MILSIILKIVLFCLITNFFALESIRGFSLDFFGIGRLFKRFTNRRNTNSESRSRARPINQPVSSDLIRQQNYALRGLNGNLQNYPFNRDLSLEEINSIIEMQDDHVDSGLNRNIIPMEEMAEVNRQIEALEASSNANSRPKPKRDVCYEKSFTFAKCVIALSNSLSVSENQENTEQPEKHTAAKKNVNYQVTCPICYSDMLTSGKIVSTTCGHIYCESCIKRTIDAAISVAHGALTTRQVRCPECQQPIGDIRTIRLPVVEYQIKKRIKVFSKAIRECQRIQKELKTEEEREDAMRYKKYRIQCSCCSYNFAKTKNENPKCLKCGHVICDNCNQNYVAEKKKCPVCRKHANSEETRKIILPEISTE